MSTAQQNHRTTTSSLRALTEAIQAHIAREQLSRCGFGTAALGDASFPGRLGRGSNVHLGTADKVLACMNPETIGPSFLRRAEAFLKVTGIRPHVLGKDAPGDPSFVLRLERGRSPTLGTVDKVRTGWRTIRARRSLRRCGPRSGTALRPSRSKRHCMRRNGR